MNSKNRHFAAQLLKIFWSQKLRFILTVAAITLSLQNLMIEKVYAQDEVQSEDNYDPFSDYSEFNEASSEEADINFFRNGRLLSIGILAGGKSFLGDYSDFYGPGAVFGVFVNYFFDLQFAVQIGMTQSDHSFSFSYDGFNFNAKMRLLDLHAYGKYFFNTQNMTRSFAEWNPYLIGGVSQIRRSHASQGGVSIVASNDNTYGIDVGGGVEYIFNNKKNFVGFMFLYQFVPFASEGEYLHDPNLGGNTYTNYMQKGDPFSIMATLGINY